MPYSLVKQRNRMEGSFTIQIIRLRCLAKISSVHYFEITHFINNKNEIVLQIDEISYLNKSLCCSSTMSI